MSHLLSIPNLVSLNSFPLLSKPSSSSPHFLRPPLFSISNTRRWRTTTRTRHLYVKACDAQHNSPDPQTHNKDNNSSRGGGVIGATLAGVVLAVGVASAFVFVNKQSALSHTKQMEVSTPHQEEFVDTYSEEKGAEDDKTQSMNPVDDIDSLQNVTGISDEISPSLKIIDDSEELQFVDVDYGDKANGVSSLVETEYTDTVPIQDDAQDESSLGTLPLEPYLDLNLDSLPGEGNDDQSVVSSQSKETDARPFSSMLESNSDTEEGFIVVDPSVESLVESYTSSVKVDEPTEFLDVNTPIPVDSSALSETNTLMNFDAEVTDATDGVSSVVLEDDVIVVQSSSNAIDENDSVLETRDLYEYDHLEMKSAAGIFINEFMNDDSEDNPNTILIDEHISPSRVFSGVPAPTVVSPALQVPLGKIVVPAAVDQLQSQALTALQVLKVIEPDTQPGDICTRREFARWLVSASSVLSRSTISKVYPAMYIENGTELAFDDVTPDDPDFPSIQGLAEAGLIASKLSQGDSQSPGEDKEPLIFSPESPLSRQDLVSWKIALETRKLPEADRKTLYQASGFVDIDRINPAAWPALVADLASGDQGIIPLAFGYTRLFQPAKPVTKAQAAIALAVGESSYFVNEELARIEAESMAENAVAEHNNLVAQVEKDLTDNFEKKLQYQREVIFAVEKMAEEAKEELEKIRFQRNEDKLALAKEKAAAELEMEVLSKLKREVDSQLYDILSNKVEISYEKERIITLRKEVEADNQEIVRLQYELEIERKALAMARAWAEDEAKKAREQAKALEVARERWERRGLQIVVDDDLRQEALGDSTWVNAGKVVSVEETSSRAEILVGKLKAMANDVSGRAKVIINVIIDKIVHLISAFKEKASNIGKQSEELKGLTILKVRESTKALQQSTAEFTYNVTEGVKGVAEECKGSVTKLSQRFNNRSP